MEITLLYNKSAEFTKFRPLYDFNPDGGKSVFTTMARQTGNLEIPITAKLLADLKTSRSVPEVSLSPGQSVNGPKISVGFKDFAVKSKLHIGYLDVSYVHLLAKLTSKESILSNNFKFRLDIESLKEYSMDYNLIPRSITHVFIVRDRWPKTLSKQVCFVSTTADDKLLRFWPPPRTPTTKSSSEWTATVSLSMIVCPKASPYEGVKDHLAIYGKMLNNEKLSDTTIIAEGNVEIKCHRSVLAAHSPVFEAMFRTGMKEAESGVLDQSGMSGEGVHALLDFLYLWKSEKAQENPLVCVELLEVGDKYNILSLGKCMVEDILLVKDLNWFTPEAALRLVLHLKDADWLGFGYEDRLKQKAIEVYKSKFSEVRRLPAYEEICREKPEILKTLLEYFSSDSSLMYLINAG